MASSDRTSGPRRVLAWLRYLTCRILLGRDLALLVRSPIVGGSDDAVVSALRQLLLRGLDAGAVDLVMRRATGRESSPEQWARSVLEHALVALSGEPGAGRRMATQVAERFFAFQEDGSPRMPLVLPLCSENARLSCFDGDGIVVMPGSIISPDSRIGAHTYIGYRCLVSKASIGPFASIADDVLVGPGEHALHALSTSSLFYEQAYEELTLAPCTIGADAWIGAQTVVRRGVTIGVGAVVGANSFVNADVEDFAIVAGSPARVIGWRFEPAVRELLKASRWWDYPVEQARQRLATIRQSMQETE